MGNNEMKYLGTPLWNPDLSWRERAQYLVSHMTIEEKLRCLGTGCIEIKRYGVPFFHVGSEAAHGVQARHDQSFDKGEPVFTTIFPNPIGMSATWNRELIKNAGNVSGTESRAIYSKYGHGRLTVWAPTVDMERDPRWGRTEEAYGEDPFLTGEMAGAYVTGLQGDDREHLLTAATLKHFYGNNVENGRVYKSSSIDPRNREEYYFEPFRRIIEIYGADGIMTSYNQINGIPATLNREVKEVAKKKWGLNHVVCDGGALSQVKDAHGFTESHTDSITEGLKAGIDCFTDDMELVYSSAKKALEQGKIDEKMIDEALINHFGVMVRVGIFDPKGTNPYEDIRYNCIGCDKHRETAAQVAREAVVLLKNSVISQNKKKLLPINRNTDEKIAVIGPLSNAWYKDWYSGVPPYTVTCLQGMERIFGKERIIAEDGIRLVRIKVSESEYMGIDPHTSDVIKVSWNEATVFAVEYWDDKQITIKDTATGMYLNTYGDTVRADSKEAFNWFVKDIFCIRDGMLRTWNGSAMFWDDSGKLVPYPENSDVLAFGEAGYVRDPFGGKNPRPSIKIETEIVKDGINEAVDAAKHASVAVVCLGPNPVINCKEDVDRFHLELSPYQKDLLRKVSDSNKKTVLVLLSSIPFNLYDIKKNIPAIVTTAQGGMEIGNAIAQTLSGLYSPSGKLPLTWYKSAEELPDMDDYDIINNERTYQYYRNEVDFPFGYGLTYGDIRVNDMSCNIIGDNIMIKVEGVNNGNISARDVIQIYFHKNDSFLKRPIKTLIGFEKIKETAPGESFDTTIKVNINDMTYFDVVEGRKLLEPGDYEIMAGTSSEDIHVRKIIHLEGEKRGYRKSGEYIYADMYDIAEGVIMDRYEGEPEGHSVVRAVDVSAKMCYKNTEIPKNEGFKIFTENDMEGISYYFEDIREECGVKLSTLIIECKENRKLYKFKIVKE